MQTQRFKLKIDILTRDNGEKFAFVGNVIFRAIHERYGAIVCLIAERCSVQFP